MAVKDHLTPQETHQELTARGVDVSLRTVRRWIASGRLRSITLPSGRPMVPSDALTDMFEEKAEAAS